jgi:hypothetical protein
MEFHEKWKERLLLLQKDEVVSVVGSVSGIGQASLHLGKCEVVE